MWTPFNLPAAFQYLLISKLSIQSRCFMWQSLIMTIERRRTVRHFVYVLFSMCKRETSAREKTTHSARELFKYFGSRLNILVALVLFCAIVCPNIHIPLWVCSVLLWEGAIFNQQLWEVVRHHHHSVVISDDVNRRREAGVLVCTKLDQELLRICFEHTSNVFSA